MIYTGSYAKPRMDLGEALYEFAGQEDKFIADKVFKPFNSPKKEGTFSVITRDNFTTPVDTLRAKASDYNRKTTSAKDHSFSCQEHGLEELLDDGDRVYYASDFDAELAITKTLGETLLLQKEIRVANKLFDPNLFKGADLYTAVSTPWSTTTSDIIGDIETVKTKAENNSGKKPNALVITPTALKCFKANTAIQNSINYTRFPGDNAYLPYLAELFGFDFIFMGRARKNTASKGATFTGSNVWNSAYVSVCRVATGETLSEPCIGRNIQWEADAGSGPYVIEEYREEKKRSNVYRVRTCVDENVFDTYQAHLIRI